MCIYISTHIYLHLDTTDGLSLRRHVAEIERASKGRTEARVTSLPSAQGMYAQRTCFRDLAPV